MPEIVLSTFIDIILLSLATKLRNIIFAFQKLDNLFKVIVKDLETKEDTLKFS